MKNQHTLPISLGIFGLGCLLTPTILSLPGQLEVWAANQEKLEAKIERETLIQTQAEIDRAKIRERAKTAKLAAQNRVSVPNRTLRMTDYIYRQGEPPARISTRGYLSSDRIQVYDSTGICFGEIYRNKFRFIDRYPNVCDNPPDLDGIQGATEVNN